MRTIFICCILFIQFGCSKVTKFNINEIVQTDTQGNIIGSSVNSMDWKIVNYSSSDYFADINSALMRYYTNEKKENLNINFNCKLDNYNIKFYPNPMIETQKSYTKINFSTKIKDVAYGYKRVTSGIITIEVGFDSTCNCKIDDYTILLDIQQPAFNNGEDVEYFYCVLDENNCTYYFSGKVKVQ